MKFDRRQILSLAGGLTATVALPLPARSAPPLRITSVKMGSVSWLIETIQAEGLDKKHGLELSVLEVATNQAAPIALLAGEVDVTVSDWTWGLKQRSKGQDFKFASYSSALGGVVVPKDSTITSLAALEGKTLGVAGSSNDKSWLLMRAYSPKKLGKDIAEVCDTVFGAAPLITEEFKSGRLDACLNFWTFAARLVGQGSKQILTMAEVIKELGIDPAPPLVGFIWSERAVAKSGAPIDAWLAAANEANEILGKSDEAWVRLRPLVKPANDAEFASIIAAFRDGITAPWSAADTAGAEKLTNLLVELGDMELVGDGTRFDPNLFYTRSG